MPNVNHKTKQRILSLLVLLFAYFTYFQNYNLPDKMIWDENYHIVSAYKYVHQQFFMEPHPPLGKLVIAAGELLFNKNEKVDPDFFLKINRIKKSPKNFDYTGVRFFPVLFSMLVAVLFFNIACLLLKNSWMAFALSSFYLFDNAFIAHSRAAMLEPIQLFFILAAIYYYLLRLDKKNHAIHYMVLGVFIGLASAVKLNGLILLLLFPMLFLFPFIIQQGDKDRLDNKTHKESKSNVVLAFLGQGLAFVVPIIIVFLLSFYLHFSLATQLSEEHYNASPEYIKIVQQQQGGQPQNFWLMFKENMLFVADYEKKVPKHKKYNIKEKGSSPLLWPFAYKPISYRWDKKKGLVSHVYLIANPLIWFLSLAGLFLSVVYILAVLFFRLKVNNQKNFFLIVSFSLLYFSYMIVMFKIERVMYLYHYFIPLIFSMFISILMFKQFFIINNQFKQRFLYVALALLFVDIYYVYTVFSPLTYHLPMSLNEFDHLNWFDYWELDAVLN